MMKFVLIALFVTFVFASCENNCNNHGECSEGLCVCNDGWGGDDCSIFDHAIESGSTQSGHLTTFEWKYYHINLPSGANGIDVQVTQTSDFGDIDLFVQKDSLPSQDSYSYKDTSSSSHLSLHIEPATDGVWYFGLYGYWSADYEITIDVLYGCTVDCGDFGTCNIDVCSCYEPYNGEDCSIFDQGLESGVLTSNSVETGEWKYYHIIVAEQDSMYLSLVQDSTDYDLDIYIATNGYPSSRFFSYLNATTDAQTNMHLDGLSAAMYYVGVYGYRGGHYDLTVSVFEDSSESCTNDCSAHGSCSSSVCECYDNFSGDYCEHFENNMEIGVAYPGFVGTGNWNFWTVNYFSEASLLITVTQTSETGDSDIYVKSNQDPTRVNYQVADLSLEGTYSVSIQNPGDEVWHIGIYGWTTCDYIITVELVEECQCTDASHGTCRDGSNQCICNLDYAGNTCEIETSGISNGEILSGSVEPHTWEYFHFTSDSSVVSVTMTETESSGDLFLAISLSGYPSGENFDYYDIEDSSFHEVHFVWGTQGTVRTYFIGVLTSTASVATDSLPFSITAYGTPF